MIELDDSEGLLTTDELARTLGMRSHASIHRAAAAGRIPAVQIGAYGHWRFSAKWVREWLERGEEARSG